MFEQAEEEGRQRALDPNQQPTKRKRNHEQQEFAYHVADLMIGAEMYRQILKEVFLTAMSPHVDELM
eukprot:6823892-Ditylum_brightwellii.AAC.1